MIKLVNLQGKAFFLPAATSVTEKLSVDGQLRFTVKENKYNREIVKAISKKWRVKNVGGSHDQLEYVINFINRKSNGFKQEVEIIAIEAHIEDLKNERIYENYSGSIKGDDYFNIVFRDIDYKCRIDAKLHSLVWENAGDGDTRADMFKNGLKRYGLEYQYDPSTKTFILTPFVSNKVSNYYISNEVNANSISIEEDSTELFTYIRGYGDYDENSKFQEAGLQLEFTHPLASILGKIHAPIIADGKIKDEKLLRSKMEDVIDNSLKVSITVDFLALSQKFKGVKPKIGDLVKFLDKITDIFDVVRIIEIKTEYDANNKIIKQDVVLGDYKRHQRYEAAVNNATSYVTGISGGSKSILTMKEKLDNTVKMTNNLIDMGQALNASSEGLKSVNGLSIVEFHSKHAIQYSNDGGKTYKIAINGDGINPNAIPLATELENGIMSKEDKRKLNNLTNTGANNNRLGSIFYKEVKNNANNSN
ncbi:tail tube TT1 domain-containing protein [Mammaliicoccus sciuri]|uniref:tail tube TT1 domain-containing protein n=1 Tax=Mammaliicoccus sciuri TaxID=1296 RepID=UPI001C4EFC85|nr:phage tail protein [Mammaliicoccus sciuri]